MELKYHDQDLHTATVQQRNGNKPQATVRILVANEIVLPPTPATTPQKTSTDGPAIAVELPNNSNSTNKALRNQSNTHT